MILDWKFRDLGIILDRAYPVLFDSLFPSLPCFMTALHTSAISFFINIFQWHNKSCLTVLQVSFLNVSLLCKCIYNYFYIKISDQYTNDSAQANSVNEEIIHLMLKWIRNWMLDFYLLTTAGCLCTCMPPGSTNNTTEVSSRHWRFKLSMTISFSWQK